MDINERVFELHSEGFKAGKIAQKLRIKKAVVLGNKIGLEVHAGHGLTYKSAKILSKVKGISEFNIGHFLIGESIFIGLSNSVKKFK